MNINNVPKSIVALNSECNSECRLKILKLTLSLKPIGHDYKNILEKLSKELNIPKPKILQLVGLYLLLIQYSFDVKETEFDVKLTEIGFPEDFIKELPFYNSRARIVENLNKLKKFSNSLITSKWRIDISLSDSVLLKKLPKNVILCLELRDGQKYCISIDVQTFHRLRYNVALIINEMKTVPLLNK